MWLLGIELRTSLIHLSSPLSLLITEGKESGLAIFCSWAGLGGLAGTPRQLSALSTLTVGPRCQGQYPHSPVNVRAALTEAEEKRLHAALTKLPVKGDGHACNHHTEEAAASSGYLPG